jgi:DNA modification methylase
MGYQLYCGDWRNLVPELDLKSIGAVITDPPYGMGWDGDNSRFSSGSAKHKGTWRGPAWPKIAGDEEDFDPAFFLRFPRVVLWGWNHYAARLPVGTTLVWIKKHDHCFHTFLSDAEIAWMKGGKGVYCCRKVWAPETKAKEGGGRSLHPNQKPVELMRWCMDMAKVPAGAVVFDPFMGSGTVGVACLESGREYIGCEIDPGYFAIAEQRLKECASRRLPLEV